MSLASGSCALVDALDDSQAIKYPESGIYGLNMLAPAFNEASGPPVQYSFRAELGDEASLRVKVDWTNSDLGFGYSPANNVGWVITLGDGQENIFVALQGQHSPDVSVIAGQKAGQLSIEYFENDDLIPTFTKIVNLNGGGVGIPDGGRIEPPGDGGNGQIGDAGPGGPPLEFMSPCNPASDQCDVAGGDFCFLPIAGPAGPFCTHTCVGPDDCPSPSSGCDGTVCTLL